MPLSTAQAVPRDTSRVVIVGGGLVGLTLAAALNHDHIDVAVVEHEIPPLAWSATSTTAQVSAINLASMRLLRALGVWQRLPEGSYGLFNRMHVWDGANVGHRVRANTQQHALTFDARQLGLASMGAIVENRALVAALWSHCHAKHIPIYCPAAAERYAVSREAVTMTLADQSTLTAALVVGADGGQSAVRRAMGINWRYVPYMQKAIVAVLQTQQPHHQTAYQVFLPSGPLALLPMADPHRVVLVWTLPVDKAAQHLKQSIHAFNTDLGNYSKQCLGELGLVGLRQSFPLVSRHASAYVAPRMALVGDAAHTIHPLAGQGANLGFMDAACLAETLADRVKERPDVDLGGLRGLRRYERWRRHANTTMRVTMSILNDVFQCQSGTVNALRQFGFDVIQRTPWLKAQMMEVAMGDAFELPRLAQQDMVSL